MHRLIFALLSIGLVAACTSGTAAVMPTASPEPTATSPPAHSDCPPPATTVELSSAFAPVAGGSPVWISFAFPAAIVPINVFDQTPYGLGLKRLWVVEAWYTGTVTVKARNVDDETPVKFLLGARGEPSTTVTLDTRNPGIPLQHEGFLEWPSMLYLSGPGCYMLEATWATGNWQINFTVTP